MHVDFLPVRVGSPVDGLEGGGDQVAVPWGYLSTRVHPHLEHGHDHHQELIAGPGCKTHTAVAAVWEGGE